MNHNEQHPHQRQVDQFTCTQCRFTTVDVEGNHVNNHMVGASSYHSPNSMPSIQQLRERNLFYNPFSQLLFPAQPTTGTSGSNRLQKKRSPKGSNARGRAPIQSQTVQSAEEIAGPRPEEAAEASTMPLIDQLDRPIPIIISLDDDPNDDDNQVDLTLRL